MVVIDATMLMLLIQPSTRIPNDKAGKRIEHARERIEGLIDELERTGVKVLIPTPALSEVLVRAGAARSEQIVDTINKQSVFGIVAFDARAAIRTGCDDTEIA